MKEQELLTQLGLSENEIRTFLTLSDEPEGCSVLRLSRVLNLPRGTIYGHIQTLIEKGLVKKGLDDNGSVFYPEAVENITKLFQERSQEIQAAGELFSKSWESRSVKESYRPKFLLFDTKGAAEAILRDIIRSREPMTYWFWPIKEMIRTIPQEVFVVFNRNRIERNIEGKVLWPSKRVINLEEHTHFLGPVEKTSSLREVRILPGDIDTTMGYCVYGNKVAFISSQREHYGFIIDSKELAKMHKSQFKYFWKQAEGYIQ